MEQYIEILEKMSPNKDIPSGNIVSSIFATRYLLDEFIYYPEYVVKRLFEEASVPDLVYCPFDIIELRKLVREGAKGIKPKSLYFSFEFAKQHFLDNPILIGFSLPHKQLGSMFIPENDCSAELKRIYIRDDAANRPIYNTVLKILQEEDVDVDINNILDVPMLKPKAKQKFNMKKYAMETIQLSPIDKKIFNFLLQEKSKNPALSNIKLRVAGGWVRDKLLGLDSDDIDISIDNMTGQQFLNAIGLSGGHVIEKNPEKSKQLETVKADLFGQEVDFVNLRTEVYEPGSRIPTMTVTDDPAEDAKRRDLTINALFYNIETGQVEDYVGGLNDLKTMKLKTPQDPIKTFTDDPLRMLRVLRFYSRYPDSKIDPEIVEAMKNPYVQKAYDSLAPERASKELRKMITGAKPVEATKILLETGLYKKVFKLPEDWHPIDMDQQSPYHDFGLMQHTLAVMKNYSDIADKMGVSKDEKGLMLLASLFHDFGKMSPEIRKMKIDKKTGKPVTFDRRGVPVEQMRYMGHDKESAKFTEKIMKEMGFSPQEKKFVTTIVENHMTPHNMSKKVMGKFLNVTDDLFEKIVGHAQADALSKSLSEEEAQSITQKYETQAEELRRYREELGERLKTPLLDGNKIRTVIRQIAPELVANPSAKIEAKGYGSKPVHFMTYFIDKMKEQQWRQQISTPEEAEHWLRGAIRQFVNLWKQQQQQEQQQEQQPPIDLNKQADASSGTLNSEFGFEGKTPTERTQGITYLSRTVPTQYEVGSKVRLDVSGLNFEPIEGRIISKKDNIIIVKWTSGRYKGKRKSYDLTDTISLTKLNVI